LVKAKRILQNVRETRRRRQDVISDAPCQILREHGNQPCFTGLIAEDSTLFLCTAEAGLAIIADKANYMGERIRTDGLGLRFFTRFQVEQNKNARK